MASVAKEVRHDVAAFDSCNGVFDRDPHLTDDLVDGFLDGVKFPSAWFLLGLERIGIGWLVALEARVLDHQCIGRVGQSAFVGEFLVVHAARTGRPEVHHALFTGNKQVLFSMGLLLAAVVFLLLVLVFGAAHGSFHPVNDQQTQFGHLGQKLVQVGGSAGRQKQLASEYRVDLRGKLLDPLARLGLAHAKEKGEDLLQGIALEVEKEEQELGCRRGQLAGLSTRSESTLARQSIVATFQPSCRQKHLQTQFQAHELRPVQRGECPQEPTVA